MGGVKVVAGSCNLHLHPPMQQYVPCSTYSPPSQSLASIFSSISSSSYSFNNKNNFKSNTSTNRRRSIDCHSPFLGTTKLSRRSSLDDLRGKRLKQQHHHVLPARASSDNLSRFVDSDDDDKDEFVTRLDELASKLPQQQDRKMFLDSRNQKSEMNAHPFSSVESPWLDGNEIVPVSVELKSTSVDLPVSLRIIRQKKKKKKKKQLEKEYSSCSSVNKAFSSMLFMVRELHSYALQMREILFYENLQGILARVQGDMNASFVWLFQQVFSSTPTLMVYVMLLLANFTVYSIGHNFASASATAVSPPTTATHYIIVATEQEDYELKPQRRSSIKSFSGGRTASVDGGGGSGNGNGNGGGNVKPVAGDANERGQSDESSASSCLSSKFIPDGALLASPSEVVAVAHEGAAAGDASEVMTEEEEVAAWNRIVEEAYTMRDEALMDPRTLQHLVSPVTVELEPENDYAEYLQTELRYHQALSKDPNNALLLSNFAQFLYLVLHDHDRAEYYFKLAVGMQPADAEALNQYANFLWLARQDLTAAEETYLKAIDADPSNSHYAANYAHFLWNTGGEDTCYPLYDTAAADDDDAY